MARGPSLTAAIQCLGVLCLSATAAHLVAVSRRNGQMSSISTSDGGTSRPLVIHNVESPSFVDADLSTQSIYWADDSSNNRRFIGRYNFTSRGETVVAELPFGARVVGLAADGGSGNVYYADATNGSVVAVRANTGALSTVIQGLNGSTLCCLAVNVKTGELYWKESAYASLGVSIRDGIYAYKYSNVSGGPVPEKRLLYSERKPLTIRAVTVESTGTYVFWCSTGDDGSQALLQYDLSGAVLFNVPLANVYGNCTSLAADGEVLYIMTAFDNGSNAVYSMPLKDSTGYITVVAPEAATYYNDIAVADVLELGTGKGSPTTTPLPSLTIGLAAGLPAAALVAAIAAVAIACNRKKKPRASAEQRSRSIEIVSACPMVTVDGLPKDEPKSEKELGVVQDKENTAVHRTRENSYVRPAKVQNDFSSTATLYEKYEETIPCFPAPTIPPRHADRSSVSSDAVVAASSVGLASPGLPASNQPLTTFEACYDSSGYLSAAGSRGSQLVPQDTVAALAASSVARSSPRPILQPSAQTSQSSASANEDSSRGDEPSPPRAHEDVDEDARAAAIKSLAAVWAHEPRSEAAEYDTISVASEAPAPWTATSVPQAASRPSSRSGAAPKRRPKASSLPVPKQEAVTYDEVPEELDRTSLAVGNANGMPAVVPMPHAPRMLLTPTDLNRPSAENHPRRIESDAHSVCGRHGHDAVNATRDGRRDGKPQVGGASRQSPGWPRTGCDNGSERKNLRTELAGRLRTGQLDPMAVAAVAAQAAAALAAGRKSRSQPPNFITWQHDSDAGGTRSAELVIDSELDAAAVGGSEERALRSRRASPTVWSGTRKLSTGSRQYRASPDISLVTDGAYENDAVAEAVGRQSSLSTPQQQIMI